MAAAAREVPDLEKMSVDEQIDLVQSIWDHIASRPELVSVTDAQRAELDRRLAAHRANPDAARPWPHVRAEIEDE